MEVKRSVKKHENQPLRAPEPLKLSHRSIGVTGAGSGVIFRPMFEGQNTRLTIAALGEKQLIKCIQEWMEESAAPAPDGIGDDCAVLHFSGDITQLLTTDSLTYRTHFDDKVSPEAAGAKLVKRNLSDIAAMGGAPGPALLNLLMAPNLSIHWLERFITGLKTECSTHGVKIVGGDISTLPTGQFTAILMQTGQLPIQQAPIYRSTAKLDDWIYVTGTLGGSILSKHHAFEPRLKEGQWLAAHSVCTALMDITDGLAKDLEALLPKHANAALNLVHIPISADAHLLSKSSKRRPIEHAFCDGEDYELLFTLSHSADKEKFEADWHHEFSNTELSCIGKLIPSTDASRSYIDADTGKPLPWTQGFEHLKA
jgi:thiamine-monophosphate kinase